MSIKTSSSKHGNNNKTNENKSGGASTSAAASSENSSNTNASGSSFDKFADDIKNHFLQKKKFNGVNRIARRIIFSTANKPNLDVRVDKIFSSPQTIRKLPLFF